MRDDPSLVVVKALALREYSLDSSAPAVDDSCRASV